MKKYPRVLTIAGSDCGGGAGIQADLKTFSALGVYGSSAITAITVQNTCGVQQVHVLEPKLVAQQIDAVLSDVGADVVKIGMLCNAEIIRVVAELLQFYRPKFVVLDPILTAKDGTVLLEPDVVTAMQELLFPLTTVLTPNLPEASFLWGRPILHQEDVNSAAQYLLGKGVSSVLIKGGHAQTEECSDCFAFRDLAGNMDFAWLTAPRVATKNTHGTGCTLSSAIAAFLARGLTLPFAVQNAKQYVTQALQAGAWYKLGKGIGPVCHFYPLPHYQNNR